MSTHAEVFVETRRGRFTGTYVHFDGYPDTCGKGVACRSYQEIKDAVLSAQKTGGLRFVGPDSIEPFADKRSCVIPSLKESSERYVYVKRLSGTTHLYVNGALALWAKAPKKKQQPVEPPPPATTAPVITGESVAVDCAQEELLGFVIRKLQARGELVQADVERAAKILRGSMEFGLNAALVTLGLK